MPSYQDSDSGFDRTHRRNVDLGHIKQLESRRFTAKPRLPNNKKRCSNCGGEFPATRDHFSPLKACADGLSSWCKTCKAAGMAEYRQWVKGGCVGVRATLKRKDGRYHDALLSKYSVVEQLLREWNMGKQQLTLKESQLAEMPLVTWHFGGPDDARGSSSIHVIGEKKDAIGFPLTMCGTLARPVERQTYNFRYGSDVVFVASLICPECFSAVKRKLAGVDYSHGATHPPREERVSEGERQEHKHHAA